MTARTASAAFVPSSSAQDAFSFAARLLLVALFLPAGIGKLTGVKCPVLAIHGEDDEYGSIRHPFLIAEKVAGESRMAILPATGHVPHREIQERVVHIAGEFLAAA